MERTEQVSDYLQEPPFAVQVELTEGCNLRCNGCGLNGIRGPAPHHDLLFMSGYTAESVARQLAENKWTARIEFAMHGEPSLHPDYAGIIAIFRKHLHDNQLMMTSNGGGLLRPPGVIANLTELFNAGLNIFAFDAYEFIKIKDKVDELLFVPNKTSGGSYANGGLPFEIHRYPDEKDYSPHSRYGPKRKLFIRVQDIGAAEKGTHSVFNNHAGGGMKPLRKPLQARCAKPFRELAVRWNGDVAGCCNDFRGVYKCGNMVRDGLLNVWNGPRFESMRKFLMVGDRASINPCNVCDAKSYRVGLLPDKKGKVKLDEPTEKDLAIVRLASSGLSYTPIVKRDWEK